VNTRKIVIVLAVVLVATSAAAFGTFNFGEFRDNQLEAHSQQLFGIVSAVGPSSNESISAGQAEADPTALVTLAKGLHARVLSAHPALGANLDMMALWPNDANPTHIIACNEQGTTQPAVQRIRISNGQVETILTGMNACDPVKRTAWGTVIVGEEVGNTGWLLEIINPLATTNVAFNRTTGVLSGANAGNIATRPAVGRNSFEGLALYPNGLLYYGDENRPSQGTAGGAYFKFIPANPWAGGTISNLSQSPLTAGTVYGLRLGKRSNNTDYGQGTNTGKGVWVPITPNNGNNVDLRAAAALLKLTGYYRPEDAEIDPVALAQGQVRFCGNNTGNEIDDSNFGETICVTDGTLANAMTNVSVPEVQYLVIGTPDLAMMDNLTYQPIRGNWIIQEDGDGPDVGRNNDMWSCVEDGDDDDKLSDGCAKIGTLNDLNAEWTGGIFDQFGNHFYVSVQHNITGHGVILDITGWK
jgi:secreted PhoX family phosphatase